SVPPSEACMVQLLGGGGALSSLRPEDTAVYWRHARFIVQYDGFWTAPDDGRKIMDWVEQFRNDMLSYTEGAYVNYVDSRIAEPLEAYYGKNLERLRQVKKRYDPDNFFHFPQSIPPSS
ncbi:MAG: BBE domain-containing protein, partial [Dehalococcoidia bacterium]